MSNIAKQFDLSDILALPPFQETNNEQGYIVRAQRTTI